MYLFECFAKMEKLTNGEVFRMLGSKKAVLKKSNVLHSMLLGALSENFDDTMKVVIEDSFRKFHRILKVKWRSSNRTEPVFITQNSKWLNSPFLMPAENLPILTKRGAKSKPFSDCSQRQKLRRTATIRSLPSAELAFVASKVIQQKDLSPTALLSNEKELRQS